MGNTWDAPLALVVSVPAHFTGPQRAALLDAIAIADLPMGPGGVHLLNDGTALAVG